MDGLLTSCGPLVTVKANKINSSAENGLAVRISKEEDWIRTLPHWSRCRSDQQVGPRIGPISKKPRRRWKLLPEDVAYNMHTIAVQQPKTCRQKHGDILRSCTLLQWCGQICHPKGGIRLVCSSNKETESCFLTTWCHFVWHGQSGSGWRKLILPRVVLRFLLGLLLFNSRAFTLR